MNKMTELMEQLRQATGAQHQILEKQAFNQALLNQNLPLQAYIAQLQQYCLLLDVLESCLDKQAHEAVGQIWREDLRKTPWLREDLDFFQTRYELPALPATQDFMHQIQHLAASETADLLGVLYVFEGSTLGASVLLPLLQKNYSFEQQGTAFYRAYGSNTRPHWQAFKAQMNQLTLDATQQAAIIQAAQQSFTHIGTLLEAIYTAQPA